MLCCVFFFAAFQSGGVDVSQPIVLSCGGAMVAPLVAFALSLTGQSVPVYDVSYEFLYPIYTHNLPMLTTVLTRVVKHMRL